jgi:hypothetical protein
MLPVTQSVIGPRGNCFSACLASLLEVPLETVPFFLSEPGDTHRFHWASRLDAWLSQFGLYALHFAADPARAVFPGCLHIITGISPRGRPHACIGKGPRVIWDPHPDRSGLSEIDGFVILSPTWERSVVGVSGGDPGRLQAFLDSAERVLADIGAFRASLGPRDLALLQIGLHASHMEEAIVAGDELRAKAHLRALAALVQQVREAA